MESTQQTADGRIAILEEQVYWLNIQVASLLNRLQLPPVTAADLRTQRDQRTETGMGAFVSADKTSYL